MRPPRGGGQTEVPGNMYRLGAAGRERRRVFLVAPAGAPFLGGIRPRFLRLDLPAQEGRMVGPAVGHFIGRCRDAERR